MKCQEKVCGMTSEDKSEFSAGLITGREVAMFPLVLRERRKTCLLFIRELSFVERKFGSNPSEGKLNLVTLYS